MDSLQTYGQLYMIAYISSAAVSILFSAFIMYTMWKTKVTVEKGVSNITQLSKDLNNALPVILSQFQGPQITAPEVLSPTHKISPFQGSCGSCFYIRQGPTSAVCGNDLQKNISLKNYVYHDDSCELYDPDNHPGVNGHISPIVNEIYPYPMPGIEKRDDLRSPLLNTHINAS